MTRTWPRERRVDRPSSDAYNARLIIREMTALFVAPRLNGRRLARRPPAVARILHGDGTAPILVRPATVAVGRAQLVYSHRGNANAMCRSVSCARCNAPASPVRHGKHLSDAYLHTIC